MRRIFDWGSWLFLAILCFALLWRYDFLPGHLDLDVGSRPSAPPGRPIEEIHREILSRVSAQPPVVLYFVDPRSIYGLDLARHIQRSGPIASVVAYSDGSVDFSGGSTAVARELILSLVPFPAGRAAAVTAAGEFLYVDGALTTMRWNRLRIIAEASASLAEQVQAVRERLAEIASRTLVARSDESLTGCRWLLFDDICPTCPAGERFWSAPETSPSTGCAVAVIRDDYTILGTLPDHYVEIARFETTGRGVQDTIEDARILQVKFPVDVTS